MTAPLRRRSTCRTGLRAATRSASCSPTTRSTDRVDRLLGAFAPEPREPVIRFEHPVTGTQLPVRLPPCVVGDLGGSPGGSTVARSARLRGARGRERTRGPQRSRPPMRRRSGSRSAAPSRCCRSPPSTGAGTTDRVSSTGSTRIATGATRVAKCCSRRRSRSRVAARRARSHRRTVVQPLRREVLHERERSRHRSRGGAGRGLGLGRTELE